MSGDEIPEWAIFPFALGIIVVGTAIGVAVYMSGKLRDIERAQFVLVSIHFLLDSKSITKRKLSNVFKKVADTLINNSSSLVVNGLVSDGWNETRALSFTRLIESLVIKCEWNTAYEDEVAGFTELLKKHRWKEEEVGWVVSPVTKLIEDHGGRLTRTGITRSITRNVLWIIAILIFAPIIAWQLHTNEVLDNTTKYGFIEFLVYAIPALGFLIYNLVLIARKRRGST